MFVPLPTFRTVPTVIFAIVPGATVAVPWDTAVLSVVLIVLVAARWIPTRAEPFRSNSMLSNWELFTPNAINIVAPGEPFQRIVLPYPVPRVLPSAPCSLIPVPGEP